MALDFLPHSMEISYDSSSGLYVVKHDDLEWRIGRDVLLLPIVDVFEHLSNGHPRVRLMFVAPGMEHYRQMNSFARAIDSFFDRKEKEIKTLRKNRGK